jgi:lysophospholipase L1-like esterase
VPVARTVAALLALALIPALVLAGCAPTSPVAESPSPSPTATATPDEPLPTLPPVELTESDATSITAWGDSLTEQDYTTSLQRLLPKGTTVANQGVGGQTSGQIATRQGGVALSVARTTIPADGATAVAITPSVPGLVWGPDYAVIIEGTLSGVAGVITRTTAEGWLFTRARAGSVVAVSDGTVFQPTGAEEARDDLVITWMGRNDVWYASGDVATAAVRAATRAVVEHLGSDIRHHLVLSVPTATSEVAGSEGYVKVAQINAALEADWPDDFVDVRREIIDNGLELAGITPTQADLDAVAADTLPPSLMVDDVHPSALCRDRVIAPFVYRALVDRGWVD